MTHLPFLIGAYAFSALCIAGLILHFFLRQKRARRRLRALRNEAS